MPNANEVVAKVVSKGAYFGAEFVVHGSFSSLVDTPIFPTPRLAKRSAESKAAKLGLTLVWEDDVQREKAEAAKQLEEQKEAEYGVMLVRSGRCRKRGFPSLDEAQAWIDKKDNPDNYVAGRVE